MIAHLKRVHIISCELSFTARSSKAWEERRSAATAGFDPDMNPDPATETLFPGFKQVEAFGDSEEYESEVEECYVTLDLGAVELKPVGSCVVGQTTGIVASQPTLGVTGALMMQTRVYRGRLQEADKEN